MVATPWVSRVWAPVEEGSTAAAPSLVPRFSPPEVAQVVAEPVVQVETPPEPVPRLVVLVVPPEAAAPSAARVDQVSQLGVILALLALPEEDRL